MLTPNSRDKTDERMLRRCLELAGNGLGYTYPNPLVGAVITHNQTIIGEGWHLKSGQPHAEINAINSVKNKDLLPYSTLYVSLEPCSFFGKTPACSLEIIKHKIPTVIIGSIDPHEKVSGKGIALLEQNGVEVKIANPELQKEFNFLNKRFFCFHQQKRPYIFLKWAQTSNLKIDNGDNLREKPFWISNSYTKQWAHKRRTEEMAIMVGKNTVLQDNPELTARYWTGKNPIRVIIDKNLEIPISANVYNHAALTLIFNQVKDEKYHSDHYIKIDFEQEVEKQILNHLYLHNIQSVIMEGGAYTLQSFIAQNLWDEIEIVTSDISVENGTSAPHFNGKLIHKEQYADNHIYTYINDFSDK